MTSSFKSNEEEVAQIACDFATQPTRVNPIRVRQSFRPIPRRGNRVVNEKFIGYEAFKDYSTLMGAKAANMDKVNVKIVDIDDDEIIAFYMPTLPFRESNSKKRL